MALFRNDLVDAGAAVEQDDERERVDGSTPVTMPPVAQPPESLTEGYVHTFLNLLSPYIYPPCP